MSHLTYDELWRETQIILEGVSEFDTFLGGEKPQQDKREAQCQVIELYYKYIDAINNLDQCYDQIAQPQKRPLVRKLLDATIGRMLELKHELVNLDLSEFSYNDEVLEKLNMTPMEAEVCVPSYYRREREEEVNKRKKTMDDILKKLGFYAEEVTRRPMTEVEALRLIQIHERARQGRLRSQFMKEIRMMKEKSKTEPPEGKVADGAFAAMLIQKMWRGYSTRRMMRRRKIEEMHLIGMLQPVYTVSEAHRRVEEVRLLRHEMQKEYQQQYEQVLVSEKQKIEHDRADNMAEDIAEEVRSWYSRYEKEMGKFPDLPSEESGGSALIFSRTGAESTTSKSTTASSGRSKKSSKKDKDKDSKIDEDGEDLGFKMQPSNFLSEILQGNAQYREVWRDRDDEGDLEQRADIDMIQEEKLREVETEVRRIVDQMLRKELESLQAALDRDRAKKGKKAKKSAKKVRGGRKSKKKKEKDLTPDRTLESLFEELVTNGIIRKYPQVRISSFRGERSFANDQLRKLGKDPLPSLGDIRQVILEYCILPLGNNMIHQMAPLVKSLLIAGPHGCGKDMLVHAICTEVGAVLFDLSPANIVGKYPGKSGLIMLVHLVNKVSRLLQPSVIYMDGAEKPFVKKVPKTDKTDPKRLKKDLPKIVKGISPEDQIMLIGLSQCPWDCEQKALAQTYGKFLLIPRPDYCNRSALWKELLFQFPGVNRQFDVGIMSKLSDGYTVGPILEVVKEVMTCKRVLQLRVLPLTHAELINALCKQNPVYREEEEAFLQWFSKTPIGRRKARAMEIEAELRAQAEPEEE
ncbi:dynein regulatory complex protein 11 [Anabrus simplex]|uniref:dynein regulatory complex protein 11 n=1 Tax=Anabrus simplex TaxID=316456 RepID=UPI0035A39526